MTPAEMQARLQQYEQALMTLVDESERVYLAYRDENISLPHLAMAIQLAQDALQEVLP